MRRFRVPSPNLLLRRCRELEMLRLRPGQSPEKTLSVGHDASCSFHSSLVGDLGTFAPARPDLGRLQECVALAIVRIALPPVSLRNKECIRGQV